MWKSCRKCRFKKGLAAVFFHWTFSADAGSREYFFDAGKLTRVFTLSPCQKNVPWILADAGHATAVQFCGRIGLSCYLYISDVEFSVLPLEIKIFVKGERDFYLHILLYIEMGRYPLVDENRIYWVLYVKTYEMCNLYKLGGFRIVCIFWRNKNFAQSYIILGQFVGGSKW